MNDETQLAIDELLTENRDLRDLLDTSRILNRETSAKVIQLESERDALISRVNSMQSEEYLRWYDFLKNDFRRFHSGEITRNELVEAITSHRMQFGGAL